MDEVAGDLNELLDKLDIADCPVAGVSMGGYIALPFWSKYPQRVRQLVLANTRARADNEAEKAARNEMIAAIQQHGASILPDRALVALTGRRRAATARIPVRAPTRSEAVLLAGH